MSTSIGCLVVVLHYRNPAGLGLVLTALEVQTRKPDIVLLIDNNSADGSVELIRRRHGNSPLLQLPLNNGYAAGMNAGIEWGLRRGAARILLLTHDCVLAPNALEVLEGGLLSEPQMGVVGPLLIQASAPHQVWSRGGSLRRLTRRGNHKAMDESAEGQSHRLEECVWLDGAALLYRAEALEDVGLFREEFFLYEEDMEHHIRLREQGWKVACMTGARASQDTLGVPPYLAVRNHLLLCKLRRWKFAALLTLFYSLAKESVKSIRCRRVWRLEAAIQGALDARRGKLNRELALKR